MKKIITTFVFSVILFSSVGISFAQNDGFIIPDTGSVIYNNDQGGNNYGNNVFTDPSFIIPSIGSTVYNQDTNCTWCTTPIVTNTNTNNNYGNTVYTDPSFIMPSVGSTVYNYDTNCTWCTQPSAYTTPVISNTSTFTPVTTSYVGDTSYYGGINYGTNSFGLLNYGQSNYGSVNYGYVNYGQTGSSWTGVNTCSPGMILVNGTCQNDSVSCPMDSKQCSDGSFIFRTSPSCTFAACPTPTTVFNTAWCQSIGWDYVTDTVHGYCACNSGRTYSGDPVSGRGGVCQAVNPNPIACPMDIKTCSDGSMVSRTLPGCNFAVCPTPVATQCPIGYSVPTGLYGLCQKTCPNGTIVTYPNTCQTSTTCPSGTYLFGGSCIACPTGVSISPGPIGCPVNPNPTCPVGSTLVNGICQITTTQCPAGSTLVNGVCQINGTVCPIGSTLINGVCQVNTTTCPSGSTLINGVCQINGTQCPAGSTLINGICQINNTACPAGSTLINGVCQVNQTVCPSGSTLINNICQINNTVCPANSTLINGVCQAPITCPTGTTLQNGVCLGYGTTICPSGSTLINNVCQINSTTCPNGSSFINGVCQAPITCPSGTTYQNGSCVNNQVMVTCPNGSVVNYLFQCPVTYGQTSYGQTSYGQTSYGNYNYNQNYSYNIPQVVYQTCWDGSVIPNTSICQSQYKMCSNGTSIPINQTCYVAPTPVYVPPVVIKFNNVVTSVVTQITNNSARCNGIGLIAQGAQSTGWFEYGQTANLGRTTSPAIIGSSATAPFSNVLSNLQPTTTYFCRAVMQNQYGIVKGEIVKFTTKTKATTYVQPAPTKTTVKKVVKKDEIICSDGSVISVNSQTSAGMLNQGQKLIAVQMEKITGDLTVGGNVSYRLSYKNLSGTSLSGVIIKVVIPEEISLTDVPMGSYDEATHTMTFSGVSVNPYSENVINWSGTVKKEASIGKTIVTTAYVLYTIPGTQVQDEVTAYTASSIIAGQDIQKVSGANHVIGAGVGSFLPSSLVEWLALIAILFIIFILGRSIAASYKKGDEAHH